MTNKFVEGLPDTDERTLELEAWQTRGRLGSTA